MLISEPPVPVQPKKDPFGHVCHHKLRTFETIIHQAILCDEINYNYNYNYRY